MKKLSRIKRIKNRTKRVLTSVKDLIKEKYPWIMGGGGVLFSLGLNHSLSPENFPPMIPEEIIKLVGYNCLDSQLENEFDLQKQNQLQIQTGNGIIVVCKNTQSCQENKKLANDEPFFEGAHTFPVKSLPFYMSSRRGGRIINPQGYIETRKALKKLSDFQKYQPQNNNKIKNKENSEEPDKGSF